MLKHWVCLVTWMGFSWVGGFVLTNACFADSLPTKKMRANWVDGNLQTALTLAGGKKPILIQVHAHWCGPCNQLTYEVIDTPTGQQLLTQAIGVRVDFETPAGREVTKKYGILGLPTTLVLTAQGEEVGRVLGYGGRQFYLSALQDALAGKKGFRATEEQYKKDPKNVQNQLEYAQALLHRGREAEAHKLLAPLLVKEHPMADRAFHMWGRWLVRVKRDGKQGAAHFMRAIALFHGTGREHGYRYWAAKAYQIAGQPNKAMQLFQEWQKAQPKNPWVLFSQADFMVYHKYPVRDIEAILQTLQNKLPNNAWLYYLLAQVKHQQKQNEAARAAIRKAMQMNPHAAMFRYYAKKLEGKSH